jgi:uridine kinase
MNRLVEAVVITRRQTPGSRSVLVGVSGIDGSGKGYVSDRLVGHLKAEGLHAVVIHADGWLNLPAVRFGAVDPPAHFYRHAFRFDEMFERLVLPLKVNRSVRVEADFTEETATTFRKHLYEFADVDVAIVEAIFLFRPAYRPHFNLAVWLDCTFETALERALARGQEGLPPEETRRAYFDLYFPAQRTHLDRDRPRDSADFVLVNDPRLGRTVV